MINTNFAQDCPACSRPLRIRREYSGQLVVCQHCRANFTARERRGSHVVASEWRDTMMQRADELLNLAALRIEFA